MSKPIASKQRGRGNNQAARFQPQRESAGYQVADRDALQDAM